MVSVLVLFGLLLSVRAAPAAQTWRFSDVTRSAGLEYMHGFTGIPIGEPEVQAAGVGAGDYDGDGWFDLYVARGNVGANLLFRNRGDGSFEEVGAAAGVALTGEIATGPTFADVDGDGWLDLLVIGLVCPPDAPYCPAASGQRGRPHLFRNRSDGTFEEITDRAGIVVTRDCYSAALGDYDRDGDLDLFLSHWGNLRPPRSSEHLWQNDGRGAFKDISDRAGLTQAYSVVDQVIDFSFTPNFSDIDSDGWLIASDFLTSKVFRNNRDGTFSDVTTPVISDENGMGGAVGDYDNDGDLDWFVSSIWLPNPNPENPDVGTGNRLYRNRGDGSFEDATDAGGVRVGYWGWGSTFADLNNDGWLDLFHVNGWSLHDSVEFEMDPSRLFLNSGNGTFTERSAELGILDTGQGRGVVAFDYDRDGDVDLFIANNQQPPLLLRNDGGNANSFLTVKLSGRRPNTEAIGARVFVVTAGLSQMRELRAGSNFESQDPAEAHFGLGGAQSADEVRVVWPDGETSVLYNVGANQRLVLQQPEAPDCARAPNSCLAGGGRAKRKTDCFLEWMVRPAARAAVGARPPHRLRCTDGDPACDADGPLPDDRCTFRLSLCINNRDLRLPECVPSDVAAIEIRDPRPSSTTPVDRAIVRTLEQQAHNGPAGFGVTVTRGRRAALAGRPNSDPNRCGPPLDLAVPIGVKLIRSLATTSEGKADEDALMLECRPRSLCDARP